LEIEQYLKYVIHPDVKDVIYDIETYANVFTVSFYDIATDKMMVYEVSFRKNEIEKIIKVLQNMVKHRRRLVGFNNIGFDYPVLHKIVTEPNKYNTAEKIYKFAQDCINSSFIGFGNKVSLKETLIPQVDLFKINHFDNNAKATSLKTIQFNNRSVTIKDLPYDHRLNLNSDQIDELIEYNKHDVVKTYDFYLQCLKQIKFREKLTSDYGYDFINHNDTKIGKDFFIQKLEAAKPNTCYEWVDGKRKPRQTVRMNIPLKDCIFPYIKFERPEFNAVMEFFKSRVITETKGCMSDLLESDLGKVAQYANMDIKTLKGKALEAFGGDHNVIAAYPMGWFEDEQLKTRTNRVFRYKIADTLNVSINGFQYDFGVGGIHGSKKKQKFVAENGRKILDIDVSSFYPNLAIKNKIYPQHLGELFCKIYEWMYNERSKYDKSNPINGALKLALNGSYGDSNNKHSPFYDPMFTMKITVNGQLSLCMLTEELLKINELEAISINTDGITIMFNEEDESKVYDVCKAWETLTHLVLEYAEYKKVFQSDVNSYIAIKKDGSEKRKGRYEYEDLPHHKNQSALVVPKAVAAELRGECTIREFITNHKDEYDFMLRVKVARSSELKVYENGNWRKEQNVSRYYVSTSGGELVKIMPPLEGFDEYDLWEDVATGEVEKFDKGNKFKSYSKLQDKGLKKYLGDIKEPKKERVFELEANRKCVVTNDMSVDFRGFNDIDFEYYIERAEKLREGFLDIEETENEEGDINES